MKTPAESACVLLVEDDDSLRTVMTRELGRMGHEVEALADANGLAEALRRTGPDVVVLDLNLPGISGMEALSTIAATDPELPVLVCTGHGTVELAVTAMQRGAFDFLTKPVSLDVLEQAVQRAHERTLLVRENERLRRAAAYAPGNLLIVPPASEAARELDRRIRRISRADQGVLITGESGTGKELAARQLHSGSTRSDHPFVVLHCGAIPRQLIESELFGHDKGAFTGADRRRPGLFEAADGGTLFLDEVGELPLELQPALLRAVQFGEIRAVGNDELRRVDVRVIAATHRDLQEMVRKNEFREDLYYRLAVLELHVPPLRERRSDIRDLAKSFLARETARTGHELRFDEGALERLTTHDWPGNIRELENAIIRLGVLADGPCITADDVEEATFGRRRRLGDGTLPTLSLGELEALAIRAAMERFGGNKPKAAEALGIALKTLYNKLNAMDAKNED